MKPIIDSAGTPPPSKAKLSRAFLNEAKQLAEKEPAMRAALFGEALKALFLNDFDVLKRELRMLIHCTVGFEPLSTHLGITSKSLLRMLSANGNPTTKNLLQILDAIRIYQQLELKLSVAAPTLQDHPYVVNIFPTQSHITYLMPEKIS